MNPPRSSAFSLVEVLSVVSIVGLMAVLAVPMVQNLGQSRSVDHHAALLSSFLRETRAIARARGTWVRVGFHERAGGAGRTDLLVAAIYSGHGGPPSASTPSNPAEWPLLGKPLVLTGARLQPRDTLPGELPGFERRIAGRQTAFSRVIQIDPSGVVRQRTDGLDRAIVLGVAPDFHPDLSAKVTVAAASGAVEVAR